MTRWLGDLPRTLDDAHTQIRQLTAGVELWIETQYGVEIVA